MYIKNEEYFSMFLIELCGWKRLIKMLFNAGWF